jgi:hypothetical protein
MWNKFKEGFKECLRNVSFSSLVDLFIAIGLVHIISWALNIDPNDAVGWYALGSAVAAGAKR